jgi:histidinol-phosphate/aromatic aminotransferase/cobyric acid decarboxylase-like protein
VAGPQLAVLCRPSNPGLSLLPLALVDELARRAPTTLFVLDEAYLPLFDDVAPATPRTNVAVLRSLTKIFALPGVRVGYLLADAAVARAVQAALPPWNVSQPAIAAGIAALDAAGEVPAIRAEVSRLRRALGRRLEALALPVDAEGGPFLLVRVGDAAGLTAALLQRGVRVRDASSFGLPAHLRLGARPEAEQERLSRALADAGMSVDAGAAVARPA